MQFLYFHIPNPKSNKSKYRNSHRCIIFFLSDSLFSKTVRELEGLRVVLGDDYALISTSTWTSKNTLNTRSYRNFVTIESKVYRILRTLFIEKGYTETKHWFLNPDYQNRIVIELHVICKFCTICTRQMPSREKPCYKQSGSPNLIVSVLTNPTEFNIFKFRQAALLFMHSYDQCTQHSPRTSTHAHTPGVLRN